MISLIVPVYRNSENIPSLLAAVQELDASLDGDLEVVFVVDGSPDDSALRLSTTLPKLGLHAQLLELSRNFGAFEAIRAGLEAGQGDHFAVISADLQEPLSLIVDFHERLHRADCDVTIGQRVGREDPPVRKLLSGVFWAFYRRFVVADTPKGGLDVFGCTRAVRDEILRLRERNSSLVGLLLWVGFHRHYVQYERQAREIGKSSWTFRKRFSYLMDSVFSFSALPIQILLWVGVIGLLASIGFSAVVAATELLSDIPVPGYVATVLLITFFGALNCFGLGVIGQYVWRTFENTKARPGYIVASSQVFGSPAGDGRSGRVLQAARQEAESGP